MLIDFDHSIRIKDTSPYSRKKMIVSVFEGGNGLYLMTFEQGTYMYMSHRVLLGDRPHEFVDDLESFYYTLIFICIYFTGPDTLHSEFPGCLSVWRHAEAAHFKRGFLLGRLTEHVQDWWGASFQQLVENFHNVFAKLLRDDFLAQAEEKTPPTLDAEQLYSTMLGYIEITLEGLTNDM
jgi:hypothetical protein